MQTPQRQYRDISAVQQDLKTNWTTNYTKTDLAREQQNDKDLNLLYQVLAGQIDLSDGDLVQKGNYFRILYQQRQNLLVRDDIIYREFVGYKDGKTIY